MSPLIIGCVIFLLILLIVLWVWGRTESKTREAKDYYAETVGYEFDDNAQTALTKATQQDAEFDAQEQTGSLRLDKKGKAVETSLVLASLYNYNVAPNQTRSKRRRTKRKAARYFNKALKRIVDEPIAVVATETNVAPAEFVLDRAQDFYDDYMIQLQAEDPVLVQQLYVPNFDQIRGVVRNARAQVSEARAKKLSKRSGLPPKAAQQEVYYQDRLVPADPQNVHDSQVNADMRDIYQKIHTKNAARNAQRGRHGEEVMQEIRAAIQKYPFASDRKRDDATRVLEHMASDDNPTYLGGSEREVLIETWVRLNDPENKSQRGDLKGAFMSALASGMENGSEVCTMGRCARVLGSLTLLDQDKGISKPMKTTEILRTEILMKAHKVIERTLLEVPKAIADAYQNPGSISAQGDQSKQIAELENTLKDNIERTLRADYPDVQKMTLDNLIKDAQAGV